MSFGRYAAGITGSPKGKAPASQAISDYSHSSRELIRVLFLAGDRGLGRHYVSKRLCDLAREDAKVVILKYLEVSTRLTEDQLSRNRETIASLLNAICEAFCKCLARVEERQRPHYRKQMAMLRRATRVFAAPRPPPGSLVSKFKMIIARQERAMIKIFGNKIVVTDDNGRHTAEITVKGAFTVKAFPGGDDPSDNGRGNKSVSAMLRTLTADLKKTIRSDGNYTRQLFRYGAEEKNVRDRRSPEQRRFLDELVLKYREKARRLGDKFKKSDFYRDAFRVAPRGLFRDAKQLRHVLEYDEGHFYT